MSVRLAHVFHTEVSIGANKLILLKYYVRYECELSLISTMQWGTNGMARPFPVASKEASSLSSCELWMLSP
jgi:hypothetical protein